MKLLNDPTIVDFLFGGGAGGGKSVTVGIWMVLECRKYPGIRIGLGRKELTRLKQTTLHTLLHEVHPLLQVKDSHFKYNDQRHTVTYINGSEIQLVDLVYQPSDPDFDRFGSLNFTHTVIEEAGEIDRKAKDVFTSRKNRWKNQEYGIVGKSVATCNPSQNFLKLEYYKEYKNLGGGYYQKWPFGRVYVDDIEQEAYKAFVPSLATDNPFLPKNYIETLKNLPDAERKRLLEGNWDFSDTDFALFTQDKIEKALTKERGSGLPYIGVDIADTGTDSTVLSAISDNILFDNKKIQVETSDPTRSIGSQIADEIIKYAQLHGLTAEDAQRIAIDVVGVGASTRDAMRQRGWYIKEFIAGASPEEIRTDDILFFKNLRGQMYWNMSLDLGSGSFRIYEDMPNRDTLIEELLPLEYSTEEKTIVILSKKEIKKKLGGRSPDAADSAKIAYWAARGKIDPRYDSSRLIF